jgi:hypothetical protein
MLVALLGTAPALADTLVLGERLVYGKLIAIKSMTVRFAPSCGAEQDFPRSDVKQVERNGACQPRPIRPYSAGGEVCPTAPLSLYEVELKAPPSKILVSDASLAEGRLHLRSVDGLIAFHGPDTRFVGMTKRLYCREDVATTPTVPGFCAESVQWAVNFGPEPVFDNRILTRGLSFYLEDDQGKAIIPDDPRSKEVRNAFGNAVTQWIAALRDLGDDLPAEARAAVAGMESRSAGGYVLLTPPQVVRVGCRDTASFVVRYVTNNSAALTVGGRVKAARAQVEGRTLWINGATFKCWRAALTSELYFTRPNATDPQCINLTPILVHELGHAFGLPGHRDIAGRPSIMDSVIQPGLTRPTRADALDLAQILLASVSGAPAGRLDADGPGVEVSAQPSAE